MTPEVAVDLFRQALWLTTVMVAVIVVPSLLVGLTVAVFQAATQINEQTLSFLPRLLFTFVTIIFLDRKSTRLNSSHVKSSYAVFCLKKKKNLSTGHAPVPLAAEATAAGRLDSLVKTSYAEGLLSAIRSAVATAA